LGALQGELAWLRYVTIKNSTQMAQLAEFGVVFLLFSIGLELSWERLWTMRRLVFGLGGAQVASSRGRDERCSRCCCCRILPSLRYW
jgi:CPA2 family monovalent cation:H+ antiporter-2